MRSPQQKRLRQQERLRQQKRLRPQSPRRRPGNRETLNLRLDLAYDGEPYRGWARQTGQRTVQGELEEALSRVLRGPVSTVAAGRTDAGVHALGQVVTTADAPDDLDLEKTIAALNSLCGPAIVVWSCAAVPEAFSARFSARSRAYVYAIAAGPRPDPWRARTALHHPGDLDIDAMNEAAGHLLGAHDFSSFGRVEAGASAERTLFELACTRDGDLIRVTARGNAFIQQMVRSLVGTLIDVGVGKRPPGTMEAILAARDRAAAGPVAPPHGLCLVSVEYDDGWSGPGRT